MGVELFLTLVAFLLCGVIWFYILRPMLEDVGLLKPRGASTDTDVIMSRAADEHISAPPSSASQSQTDQTDSADKAPPATVPARKLVTVYALMREYNIPREKARAAFEAAGLPLDNNIWRGVAPASDEDTKPARSLLVRDREGVRRIPMTPRRYDTDGLPGDDSVVVPPYEPLRG